MTGGSESEHDGEAHPWAVDAAVLWGSPPIVCRIRDVLPLKLAGVASGCLYAIEPVPPHPPEPAFWVTCDEVRRAGKLSPGEPAPG